MGGRNKERRKMVQRTHASGAVGSMERKKCSLYKLLRSRNKDSRTRDRLNALEYREPRCAAKHMRDIYDDGREAFPNSYTCAP